MTFNDLKWSIATLVIIAVLVVVARGADPLQGPTPPQAMLPVAPDRPVPDRPVQVFELPVRSATILVPQGVSPPSAPYGWTWVRVSCSPSGCTYRLTH